jgi:deoxyribose-phosphate aldolase
MSPRDTDLASFVETTIAQFNDFQTPEVSDRGPSPTELARYIDHTLLKPEATQDDVITLCQEAIEHGFRTVCVNSCWIPQCTATLRSSSTVPIAVIGFPLGAGLTAAKCAETELAIKAGAKEIDMVLPIGHLRGKDYDYVYQDIKAVYETCGSTPLKVILETSKLKHDQIVAACSICKGIGVAFVKTSTGFGRGGATVEHVSLMKAVVGDGIEVKASGGIRTYEDAVRMYNAGARRIGASASIAIVTT